MDVRRSVADPAFDAQVNVVGFLNLIESARKHGLKRVVFSSTGGAIYGEQDEFPCTEDHPKRPVSPYGVAKLATEAYLFFYKVEYGIDYLALRFGNVYGPRQDPHGEAGVISICGKSWTASSDYLRRRHADARLRLRRRCGAGRGGGIEVQRVGTRTNIGTGLETNVNDLYSTLAGIADFPTKAQP